MGNYADIIKKKLSSMSNEEFDKWWQGIEAQRTDVNAISAAEYQNVLDNYISDNMIVDIDGLAEERTVIVVEPFEMEFSEENYNLAA